MPTSAYIHIPFCKSKCKYCSFVSFVNEDKILGYVYSLLKDIDTNYFGEKLKTLYLGGGTPSLLKIEYLKKIINKFNFADNSEITIEVNPEDVTVDYIKNLFDLGFNRISMGSQSFDDNILELIGRRHNSKKIIYAVEIIKKHGFNNINLDLIYGLPTQKINHLEKDIKTILDLEIPHISTYGLKIEENSYFYNFPPEDLPDDDMQTDMFLFINENFEKAGLNRYEVSNFARTGFESKHNLNYWNNNEYYGFGIAAHGYVDGVRFNNFCSLDEYLANPVLHEFGHFVTEKEKIEEEIFLGFRKTEGLNIKNFNDKFSMDFEKKYSNILKKYIPEYIEQTVFGYKLTNKGTLLSNIILSEFI